MNNIKIREIGERLWSNTKDNGINFVEDRYQIKRAELLSQFTTDEARTLITSQSIGDRMDLLEWERKHDRALFEKLEN